MTEAGQPNIDELQQIVAELTKERDDLKKDLETVKALQVQFDDLKAKYDSAVETNMSLIRRIPVEGPAAEPSKPLSQMTEAEQYAYLKAKAIASYEKE